jgi:glucose/arabinose dehydrogenase
VVVYNHLAFPQRFHNSLFLGDWSEGRILNVSLREAGGTYTTKTEVFLQSRPLNVTDMAVGPDGGLYFCTGGRGTAGGIFRITWLGETPAK